MFAILVDKISIVKYAVNSCVIESRALGDLGLILIMASKEGWRMLFMLEQITTSVQNNALFFCCFTFYVTAQYNFKPVNITLNTLLMLIQYTII